MIDKRMHRQSPSRESEREARRLGWFPECQITWREFLDQYPLGIADIATARDRFEHAA
jgi:hypothetical protein